MEQTPVEMKGAEDGTLCFESLMRSHVSRGTAVSQAPFIGLPAGGLRDKGLLFLVTER
jgi:hypothetical protein